MLDLSRTIEYGAEQLTLPVMGSPPESLVWVAQRIAAARYDVDWDALDYLDDPSWLTVPTLVFHGTDDLRVPIDTARQLRATKPDLVDLVEVNGADHVEAWNKDPQAYERELTAFLTRP
jgi:pimeloyl-ACP methyl ester carboxylesterase